MSRVREIDERLPRLLDEMLLSAAEITARSVGRRLGVAASTITRSVPRQELLLGYKQEQERLKAVAARTDPLSRERLVQQIADRDGKIAELNRLVQVLTASHKALLIAVGEMGGTAAWQRFFVRYERIRIDLRKLGIVDERS
jgi:hypothetical protein